MEMSFDCLLLFLVAIVTTSKNGWAVIDRQNRACHLRMNLLYSFKPGDE
jgi:hypothetical protein